mgnify:CR=1 FL=1
MTIIEVEHARSMPAQQLIDATSSILAWIRSQMESAGTPHPIRFWNFLPAIHQPLSPYSERYRAFNVGRFLAFTSWFGNAAHFARYVPTATGIGHDGTSLIIAGLASKSPGTPIENPRQVPALAYSTLYGPRPPCFVRATRAMLPGGPRLIVGGTASVRGEHTVHAGDLRAQWEETLMNLDALINQAATLGHERFTQASTIRVYVAREADLGLIVSLSERAWPGTSHLEVIRADICRRDLLLEVEGVFAPGSNVQLDSELRNA